MQCTGIDRFRAKQQQYAMKEPLMDSIFRVRELTNTIANFTYMCLIVCWKEQLSTHHRRNLLFIEIIDLIYAPSLHWRFRKCQWRDRGTSWHLPQVMTGASGSHARLTLPVVHVTEISAPEDTLLSPPYQRQPCFAVGLNSTEAPNCKRKR